MSEAASRPPEMVPGALAPSPVFPASASSSSVEDRSAGQLLRQARQAQGLHVAALAAAIKVSPQKLEALENERFDELPDPTFARALALAICRYLKIDAAPVLARLPQPREHRLEHIHRGLATTFRERPGHGGEASDPMRFFRPALLGPLLVLVAALVVYAVPVESWRLPSFLSLAEWRASAQDSAAPAGAAAEKMPAVPPELPADVSAPIQDPAAGTPGSATLNASVAPAEPASGAATPAAAPLSITATRESWVEVVDAQGRVLLSRSIPAGETVDLDGPSPLKLRIGNSLGTQVTFRGQPVPLAPVTRDNVARLELR